MKRFMISCIIASSSIAMVCAQSSLPQLVKRRYKCVNSFKQKKHQRSRHIHKEYDISR